MRVYEFAKKVGATCAAVMKMAEEKGVKFITYERGSAAFRQAVAASKYAKEQKPGEHWGETPAGRIKIQDHGDSTVSFRNIKIREL